MILPIAVGAMNVLVIAPHPDDEAIGCGGAVCLHAIRGDRVSVVFLTSGELGLKRLPCAEARRTREREAEAAAKVLGVADLVFLRLPDGQVGERADEAAVALRSVLEREAPQRIYLPHPLDAHPDHQASLAIVRHALGDVPTLRPVLMTYEVWTPLAKYDDGADITPVIRRKVRAIRCHRSQIEQFRFDGAALGLSRYRGAIAWGCRFAEVFRHASAQTE